MSSPQYWVGTSWKMNKLLAESLLYAEELSAALSDWDNRIQPFVIPPYLSARQVKSTLALTNIKVGAQNMHWESDGAWTGELSAPMLQDCQLDMVELGHSERRTHFGETDDTVGLKVRAALQHDLTPLICVGETKEERDSGVAKKVLQQQVIGAIKYLNDEHRKPTVPILFAYEPVWAIGTHGTPSTPDYANEQQHTICEYAEQLLGQSVPCLYGGSVTQENCEAFLRCESVSGLFIGRAAWDVESYLKILNLCRQTL